MKKSWRWFYHLPGNPYAYGPTANYYCSEREVRAMLREAWGFARLPRGTTVWKSQHQRNSNET